MNNLKQMTLGWQLYTDDHSGHLIRNDPPGTTNSWTGGALLSHSWPRYEGNWNHEKYTQQSPLWTYTGETKDIWRCPTDKSFGTTPDGIRVPRIRSISMNMFLGVISGFQHPDTQSFRYFRREADLAGGNPSKTFVFTDERYDSLNDGSFHVSMSGYRKDRGILKIANLPGRYHNNAGSFSFADGHVETRKWTHPMTLRPYLEKGFPWIDPSPGNNDVRWLQEHTTNKIRG